MNRNVAISYAKAICIVLMVLGHAGVPARVHQFSCLFHMPLFSLYLVSCSKKNICFPLLIF
ncbi:MAG: hypothetical protein J6R71_02285 [Bacteroidales bacterium]|nr:hypothetical protein [Bacteroidales bacterium]